MKDIFSLIGIIVVVALVIIFLDLLIFILNEKNDNYEDDDWFDHSLILNTSIAIVTTSLLIAQSMGLI